MVAKRIKPTCNYTRKLLAELVIEVGFYERLLCNRSE